MTNELPRMIDSVRSPDAVIGIKSDELNNEISKSNNVFIILKYIKT